MRHIRSPLLSTVVGRYGRRLADRRKASGDRVGNRGETERRPRAEGTRMLRPRWEEKEWMRTVEGVGGGAKEEVFGRSTWRQTPANPASYGKGAGGPRTSLPSSLHFFLSLLPPNKGILSPHNLTQYYSFSRGKHE